MKWYAILILVLLAGCAVVRIETPDVKVKAVSFLKDIDLSEFHLDANNVTLWLTDYGGVAKNGTFVFDPVTKEFRFITTSGD